jgi:serine/threonine protein kinase
MDKTDSGAGLSPQITSEYNIVRLLGEGGMGEVYLAEQLRVGRRLVALKVLNRACSENPDLKRRFENEAASAGRIRHRNVVTVYESRVTDDGQLYVAMEYVEGFDLGRVIEARQTLPLEEIIEIVRQVAAGLSAAHKLGIVHRDIKPGNIMLTREDDGTLVVKVLDFGIARLSEPDAVGSQTKTGVVMGTPHYMSPEQALGQTGEKIDHRSDIYSLAMVVYQLLTGRVAFESDSWIQVMYKHLNDPPIPPSQIRPDVVNIALADKVISKGLEKNREKRQQSATDFASELEAACAGVNTSSAEKLQTKIYPVSGDDRAMPFDPTASLLPITPVAQPRSVANIPTVATTPPQPGSASIPGPEGANPLIGTEQDAGRTASKPAAFETAAARARPTAAGAAVVPPGVPVSADGSKSSPGRLGKVMAPVIATAVCLGLVVVAFIVYRGRGKGPQEIVSNASELAANSAAAVPPIATPSPTTNAVSPNQTPSPASNTNKNTALPKDDTKKEIPAPSAKPTAAGAIEETAPKPGRNPHDAATPLPSPKAAPTVAAPAEQAGGQGGACLGLNVIGPAGQPRRRCQVTVTDGTSVMSGLTGPLGGQRFCGLTVGHRVKVRVVGPAGRLSAEREVTLTAGRNFVEIQIEKEP